MNLQLMRLLTVPMSNSDAFDMVGRIHDESGGHVSADEPSRADAAREALIAHAANAVPPLNVNV